MCPAPPVTGEDIDWNEVWKARQRRHESSRLFDDPSHNWDKHENAQRYDANAKSKYDERVKMTIAGLDISKNSRVLDIGSGPGYPGIPLKLVHPGLLMELVESAGKKANFLSTVAASLGVPGLEALRARWEDLPREPQRLGRYRLLVMRAVRPEPAHLKILAASLLQPGGIFAWWGGPEGEAEALRVTAQAGKCPVRYHASHRYELPGLKGGRCLCTWIRKG